VTGYIMLPPILAPSIVL